MKVKCSFKKLLSFVVVGTTDSITIFFALWLGDVVLHAINDVPIQLRDSLLLIPTWLVISSAKKLIPGYGHSLPELLRTLFYTLTAIFGITAVSVFQEAENDSVK